MLLSRLSLLLALAWMALLFYLSHQPGLGPPPLFPQMDKVMHFAFYAVLGIFLLGAMRRPPAGFGAAGILQAGVLASLYALSDEIHQSYIPGRETDIYDWLADTSGALTAVLVAAWLSRRLAARLPSTA